MRRRRRQAMASLLALALLVPIVHADFQGALGQYRAQQYEAARREFLRLAGVGDAASQHNLGVMALHGQGGPVDRGEAAGWFLAARENGNDDMSAAEFEALRASLAPAGQDRMARIVSVYGRAALEANVLPPKAQEASCGRYAPPALHTRAEPSYAYAARKAGRSGVAVVSYTVGTDGLAYDQNIVLSMPAPAFGQPAVDAVLGSRYAPATLSGAPIEARSWSYVGFKLTGGVSSIWSGELLAALKARAAAGELDSLFLYGVIATLDPALGESAEDAAAAILDAARGGYVDAEYWMAVTLAESRRCGADRALPWLRAAAAGGHQAASAALAERLLEGEPDAARIAEARRWLLSVVGGHNSYATKHAIAHLAASPHAEVRDAGAALRASRTLFERGGSLDPQLHEALAAARAANGDFKGAVAAERNALAAAAKLQWNPARMHERLAAYQADTMWYGDLLAVPPRP